MTRIGAAVGVPLILFLLVTVSALNHPLKADSPMFGDDIEFLKYGLTLSDQSSPLSSRDRRKYETAVARLEDRSCISSVDGSENDIGMVWANVENREELEVCLFYVASTIKSLDMMESFLNSSGFINVSSALYNPIVTQRMGIEGEGYLLNANVPIDALPSSFGSWFGIEKWGANSLAVGMFTNADGIPFDVNAIFNRN